MSTKTERWTLRVTPMQDAIVRQALRATGKSLNEYVVSCALASATDDLADRRVFALSPDEWDRLGDILDRPVGDKPRIAALLAEPSVLERPG
ncbi:DUF1778 domain-containing protein [Candidatus Poriferisodalis sp.]|uniref:type II toxin-antitoxin system TacA family antitoxin n=1 Tax=Candidatus Poriferisodalis sp. TaxID=3101277 RepID=UPI003C6FF5A3